MRILLAVVLFLVILLSLSVRVCVSFWDGRFSWTVRLWIIPLARSTAKKNPKVQKDKKGARGKKPIPGKDTENQARIADKKGARHISESAKSNCEEGEKSTSHMIDRLYRLLRKVGVTADFVLLIWDSAIDPLLYLLRTIRFQCIRTDIVIANEDAASCARLYGTVSAFLCCVSEFVSVKDRHIKVDCDFVADKPVWNLSAELSLRVGVVVWVSIWTIGNYLVNKHRYK